MLWFVHRLMYTALKLVPLMLIWGGLYASHAGGWYNASVFLRLMVRLKFLGASKKQRLHRPGHVTRMEDICMPKAVFFNQLKEGERDDGALRNLESVTKINWRGSLHRRESTISHGSRRPQAKTVNAHQWEKPAISSKQRGMKPQKKDAGGKKSE